MRQFFHYVNFFKILHYSLVRNAGDISLRSSLSEDQFEKDSENGNFRFGNVNGLKNVTVQVGTIAYMHCPVVNLGERQVSIHIYYTT